MMILKGTEFILSVTSGSGIPQGAVSGGMCSWGIKPAGFCSRKQALEGWAEGGRARFQ